MTGKIPKWEDNLWSYLSSGDGDHCPLYAECPKRQSGNLCIADQVTFMRAYLDNENLSTCQLYKMITENIIRGSLYPGLERLALNHVERSNIQSPPIPIDVVFDADEKSNVEVRRVPLKTLSGALWHSEKTWVIHINSNDTPYRQRFTLFHEMFHILAHCRASKPPLFKGSKANRGSFNELVADCFAAHALLPEHFLVEEWLRHRNIETITRTFAVPRSVALFRLKVLGLS
jgi:hypothetical protein